VSDGKTILAVIGISLWLPIFVGLSALGGCDTTSTATLKPLTPAAETGISNATVMVKEIAHAAPLQPFSGAIEAGAAAVLALLAAWQGITHSRVGKILAETPPPPQEKKT